MKKYSVGILGATGAVGQTMLKVLAERNFPISELRLLASSRSAGKKVMFKDQELTIIEAKEDAFNGWNLSGNVYGGVEYLGSKTNPYLAMYNAMSLHFSDSYSNAIPYYEQAISLFKDSKKYKKCHGKD